MRQAHRTDVIDSLADQSIAERREFAVTRMLGVLAAPVGYQKITDGLIFRCGLDTRLAAFGKAMPEANVR